MIPPAEAVASAPRGGEREAGGATGANPAPRRARAGKGFIENTELRTRDRARIPVLSALNSRGPSFLPSMVEVIWRPRRRAPEAGYGEETRGTPRERRPPPSECGVWGLGRRFSSSSSASCTGDVATAAGRDGMRSARRRSRFGLGAAFRRAASQRAGQPARHPQPASQPHAAGSQKAQPTGS